MKLKNQVVSLETAKKLKEAGIEIDSCFCHMVFLNDDAMVYDRAMISKSMEEEPLLREILPAPTLSELIKYAEDMSDSCFGILLHSVFYMMKII